MRAGPLRKRLILQSKVNTRTATGGNITTWATQVTVWGSIEPLSGQEYFAQQAVQSETKVRIVIRYQSAVDTTWRVSHGSLFYDIVSVINHQGRDRMITLMCLEGVKENG